MYKRQVCESRFVVNPDSRNYSYFDAGEARAALDVEFGRCEVDAGAREDGTKFNEADASDAREWKYRAAAYIYRLLEDWMAPHSPAF